MNKLKGLLILIGVILVIGGGALFAVSITKGYFSTGELETNKYEFTEEITDFSIDVDVSDIIFEKTSDTKCVVECSEREKLLHEVKVEGNKLIIKQQDTRKWYEQLGLANCKVKIYLPNDSYNDLVIDDSTGEINIPKGFTFNKIDIDVSTGDIYINAKVLNGIKIDGSTSDIKIEDSEMNSLTIDVSTGDVVLKNVKVATTINCESSTGHHTYEGVTAENLTINASTGRVTLTNTIINNNITINTDTGRVKFDKSDAETLNITTSTGDVTGNLLTPKSFYAKTSSGTVNVPETTGSICRINTSTGDIIIEIKPE